MAPSHFDADLDPRGGLCGVPGLDRVITREDIRRVRDTLVYRGAQEPLVGVFSDAMFAEGIQAGVIHSDVVVLERVDGTVAFRIPPEMFLDIPAEMFAGR